MIEAALSSEGERRFADLREPPCASAGTAREAEAMEKARDDTP